MDSIEQRVAQLENQVAFLQLYLGIDPAIAAGGESVLPPEFHAALQRGKRIEAVRIYRKATGASLVAAKDAVEAMMRKAGNN
ncbi:hypothetical protein SAMN05421833_11278 [Microbispora rosea]|uniref:Ribosomal protein L7/L12 C-terminal domain-containing protein n=1 Tax=Microbispora rosea TaxID=58117 RepID=A0A1N7CMM2_9ACTN|nr:hypothetical protein [Microbispora rosea]GIH46375.1 hypothetical protein Mro03_15540 [Microbispora rosea subsp. rosea]SIR64697.1 hypothetical protein SAMN05421833_11278 [Microbispora rosea]